jgi:cephalosporin hydroxylase
VYPLYSLEAFRVLSQQWLVLGWNAGHWRATSWQGRQMLQLPDDALRLAELFWRVQPDVIVETGIYEGGGTLLFAGLCRQRVIAVDCEIRPDVREALEQNPKVVLVEGDSASSDTAALVRAGISEGDRVCVFLDSAHDARHVAAELRLLGPLVSPGCFLIVADSILPRLADAPEGELSWKDDHPGVAVDAFLAEHPEFSRVDIPGVGFLSHFPNTWLRRRTGTIVSGNPQGCHRR